MNGNVHLIPMKWRVTEALNGEPLVETVEGDEVALFREREDAEEVVAAHNDALATPTDRERALVEALERAAEFVGDVATTCVPDATAEKELDALVSEANTIIDRLHITLTTYRQEQTDEE